MTGEQALQLGLRGGDMPVVVAATVFHGQHRLSQAIDGREQCVYEQSIDPGPPGPNMVQERLHHMGQARDRRKPEHRAAALDGMRHAEQRIDGLRLHPTGGQVQEAGLHGLQAFEALFEERLMELGEVNRHQGSPRSRSKTSASVRRAPRGDRQAHFPKAHYPIGPLAS